MLDQSVLVVLLSTSVTGRQELPSKVVVENQVIVPEPVSVRTVVVVVVQSRRKARQGADGIESEARRASDRSTAIDASDGNKRVEDVCVCVSRGTVIAESKR